MSNNSVIAIFGGTFDPIHLGHLHVALSLYHGLQLAEVRLVVSHQPLLRQAPIASDAQRLAMARLAIENHEGLIADDWEIKQGGPSYTITTLSALRAEVGDRPIACILGVEQFAQFNQWRDWQRISEIAHLLVVTRAGYQPIWEPEVAKVLKAREISDPHLLTERPGGYLMFQPVIPLLISATEIRHKIAAGNNPAVFLPGKVWEYIQEEKLYKNYASPLTQG